MRARDIVGDISDKEYLARRKEAGNMPRLNQVFEEMGIHHSEHTVPSKDLRSVRDKEEKERNTKGATLAAGARKRRGDSSARAAPKRPKVNPPTGAGSDAEREEVEVDNKEEGTAENAGDRSTSGAVSTADERPSASANLEAGDILVATSEVGTSAPVPSVAPLPNVLRDDSSSSCFGADVVGS